MNAGTPVQTDTVHAAWDTRTIRAWLCSYRDLIDEHRAQLTDLDRAIGDGDHGTNMARGTAAMHTAVQDTDTGISPADLLRRAASALMGGVGGASGPLYATLLLRLAAACDASGGLDADRFGAGLQDAVRAISALGSARPGDKTLLDALQPAADAYQRALPDPGAALHQAAAAAQRGCAATVPMVAARGRAAYLGERSAGHQDPGATSLALLFRAAMEARG